MFDSIATALHLAFDTLMKLTIANSTVAHLYCSLLDTFATLVAIFHRACADITAVDAAQHSIPPAPGSPFNVSFKTSAVPSCHQ